jgi:hypothetical protein
MIETIWISRYSNACLHPRVAQSVERRAYTSVVLGSSPSTRTLTKVPAANGLLFLTKVETT